MSYGREVKDAVTVGSAFGIATITFYAFIVLLVIGISFLGYWGYSYFAPKYEQVRYNTFKESQTYNDGMIRDLENLQMEYTKASDEQKAALKAIVLHRFSVYDIDRLPRNLQIFYNSVRN